MKFPNLQPNSLIQISLVIAMILGVGGFAAGVLVGCTNLEDKRCQAKSLRVLVWELGRPPRPKDVGWNLNYHQSQVRRIDEPVKIVIKTVSGKQYKMEACDVVIRRKENGDLWSFSLALPTKTLDEATRQAKSLARKWNISKKQFEGLDEWKKEAAKGNTHHYGVGHSFTIGPKKEGPKHPAGVNIRDSYDGKDDSWFVMLVFDFSNLNRSPLDVKPMNIFRKGAKKEKKSHD